MARNAVGEPKPVHIVNLKMVREKRLGYNSAITQADDVIALVRRQFRNSYRELVAVVGLDSGNKPTIVHTIALGSPGQAQVFMSSVFKPLLLSNSTGFILVHNHPGGSLSPSQADRELTDRLKKLGEQLEIKMLDHLILNADGSDYYSFKTEEAL